MKESNNPSCHNTDPSNDNGPNKNKHGKMMLICCLVPILLAIALPLLGFTESIGSTFLLLLCPLLHVGMMLFMMKNGNSGSCHGDHKNKKLENQ